MFEKLFNSLFSKNLMKNMTVLREKREISREFSALPRATADGVKSDAFWNSRGKIYGTLFNSLNGREF